MASQEKSGKAAGLSPTQKNTRAGIQRKLDAAREAYLTSARVYNREAFKLYEKVYLQRKEYESACNLAAHFAEDVVEQAGGVEEGDFKQAWVDVSFPPFDAEGEKPHEAFENDGRAIDIEDEEVTLSEAGVFRALPNDDSEAEIERWTEALE